MIVKNKVGLMSKLAIFEKSSEGKMALRDISLFRYDHIRWDLLKTGASVTVGYDLILALIIMYIFGGYGGLSGIYFSIFCLYIQ